jgi:hypothetical protein
MLYALPEDAPLNMFIDDACARATSSRDDVIPYTAEGRRGFIRISGVYLLEVSAPEDQFAQYEDTLLDITESMFMQNPCG